MLIPRYTWILESENTIVIVLCLHFDLIVRGKISALLKQTLNSSRKFNHSKFALRGSEKFEKWHTNKVGCFDILNVINIKVAELIK